MKELRVWFFVLSLVVLSAGAVKAEELATIPEVTAAEIEVAPQDSALSAAATYTLDAAHSSIGFSVKHMQLSNTKGQFNDYTATVTYDPNDLSTFSADVTIQVASIDTDNEKRDEHLRTNDFFNAEEFPIITFKSNKLEKVGEGHVITGDLTIRGVTKEISFPVEVTGPVTSPYGQVAIGISGETTINRQEFNVSFNKALDNGGLIVGDNVKINIEIELHEQK